tara:strand:- start:1607 stop:2170 length:564 start_codon:yes stop_codon:yes gene_type:complete
MPQFIHEQFIKDLSIADEYIEHFLNSQDKHVRGQVANKNGAYPDYTVKKSTELSVKEEHESDLSKILCDELQIILEGYIKIYPKIKDLSRFNMVPFNVQYYKPGEGFLTWHSERTSGSEPATSRVLVWMMYCHTIEEGGGTEFMHQDYTCKSEKGKVVMWPADWTFTHRGEPCDKEKMILTGWYNFV